MRAELNERLTRVGPDTPGGRLQRRYWHPVALAEELDPPHPVRPVRVLGEDLLLFRDDSGRPGLVERHCAHRGADLRFGRVEDGGLRCPFHGWLFDVSGRCIETPAEPAGKRVHEGKCLLDAHPCIERNGVVFAYLGGDEPPPLPALDGLVAPASHTFAFKGLIECNWMQALEVGIDPAHASWLHRFLEDEDPDAHYGKQFRARAAGEAMPLTQVLREFPNPAIDVERTATGLRVVTTRDLGDGSLHVRITNQLFPHAICIPMSDEMTITQWHTPVDDENCYWYAIFTSFAAPVDRATMRAQRLETYELPDYRPRLNRTNDYGFDPEDQRTRTYTGMGPDINIHDQWAIESQGRIQDRTREHLGTSDRAIIAYRRLLAEAIDRNEAGDSVPCRPEDAAAAEGMRGPTAIDAIAPADTAAEAWRERDRARRSGAPWAAGEPA